MRSGRTLAALMERHQLTQNEVAQAAGVSQATVSRILRRCPRRSGAAYLRLCSYIDLQVDVVDDGPEDALAAVRRIWDGSAHHAAALTELIEASKRLWPDLAHAEDPQSKTQNGSEVD